MIFTSVSLPFHLFKPRPFPFSAVVLLLLLCCSVFLFYFIWHLGLHEFLPGSFLACMTYCLHPDERVCLPEFDNFVQSCFPLGPVQSSNHRIAWVLRSSTADDQLISWPLCSILHLMSGWGLNKNLQISQTLLFLLNKIKPLYISDP